MNSVQRKFPSILLHDMLFLSLACQTRSKNGQAAQLGPPSRPQLTYEMQVPLPQDIWGNGRTIWVQYSCRRSQRCTWPGWMPPDEYKLLLRSCQSYTLLGVAVLEAPGLTGTDCTQAALTYMLQKVPHGRLGHCDEALLVYFAHAW